jgi:hypothetical protein
MLRPDGRPWRTVFAVAGMVGCLGTGVGHAQSPDDACATVMRELDDLPRVTMEFVHAIIHDDRTGHEGPGCRITMAASMRALRDGPSPDDRLRTALPTMGWVEDWEYGADGPDGTATAFRRGTVLCLLRAQWDGGDDADSTYVPDDHYDLTVGCMAAPSPDQNPDQMP